MAVQDSDDVRELERRYNLVYRELLGCTYRVICFARLAQSGRCFIDRINHAGKILAHIVKPIRQLLSKLVGSLSLLVWT